MTKTNTGIFFHYQQGERLRDFPAALEGVLEKDHVFFYDAFYPSKPSSSFELEPIPLDIIYEIHAPDMVERVKASGDYMGALYSAAGTVSAAVRIWSGEITNAFVFTGFGDHHAGSHFFGGGCYFNGAAISIRKLQKEFGVQRFALVDTDAHHGDGTWELFENDDSVLEVCFCSGPSREIKRNVNIHIPFDVHDEAYLRLAREAFEKWIIAFQPEIIFWNWGYDGTRGEYGDMGLSPEVHPLLAREIKNVALEVCGGRLIVILCGGSRRDLARYLIPRIIHVLADTDTDEART